MSSVGSWLPLPHSKKSTPESFWEPLGMDGKPRPRDRQCCLGSCVKDAVTVETQATCL